MLARFYKSWSIWRSGVIPFLWVTACFPFISPSFASSQPASEYVVKAGFILNFIRLIENRNSTGPSRLCVAGDDEVWQPFELLKKQGEIGSLSLEIERLSDNSLNPDCNVLFISRSSPEDQSLLLQRYRDRGVLSVGEDEQFLAEGGVIRFFDSNNRIQFEINMPAAQREALKISSRLLRVAKVVGAE